MTDDSSLPFDLPGVQRKKVSAAFDGGLISSDGGLVLLREADRSLPLAETLAGCIRDRRNRAQVVHAFAAMLRFRMLAIACGGACARAGEAGPVGGCRRLRRAPRGPFVQAGLREGAGERGRALLAAHHEPPGERAVPYRGGDERTGRASTAARGGKRSLRRRWPRMRTGEPNRVCIPDALFA